METRPAGIRLLLLRDRDPDIGPAIAEGFQQLGCEVVCRPRYDLTRSEADWHEFDALLAYGPHTGSMMGLARLLESRPDSERPCFVWWLVENAPDLGQPLWRLKLSANIRWHLDRWLGRIRNTWLTYNGAGELSFLAAGHRARVCSLNSAIFRPRV